MNKFFDKYFQTTQPIYDYDHVGPSQKAHLNWSCSFGGEEGQTNKQASTCYIGV